MNTTPRKPVGGLSEVRLLPVAAIRSVGIAEGRCTEIVRAASAEPLLCPLADDGSSYKEEAVVRQGLASVRHTLTLAFPRDAARDQIDAARLERWASEGVAALLTAADGERMLAGWSERFGGEQPLRLAGMTSLTGAAPHDRPTAVLVLASEDTSPALACTNECNL